MVNKAILITTTVLYLFVALTSVIEYICRIFRKRKATYYLNYYFWIPILSAALFAVISWIAYFQDGSLGVTIVFCTIEIVCIALLNVWKNCYIVYDDKGFIHNNFIGIKRKFTYNQVTAWADDSNVDSLSMSCSFYVSGKKLSFDMSSDGGAEFVDILKIEYRKIHNKHMPTIKKEVKSKFATNVPGAKAYLVVFLLLAVPLLAFLIFSIVDAFRPIDTSTLVEFNVSLYDYDMYKNDLYLLSKDVDVPFEIVEYKHHFHNLKSMLSNVNGNTKFSITAKLTEADIYDEYDKCYTVYSISAGSECYRSLEDCNKLNLRTSKFSIGYFGGSLLVIIAFFILVYIVGRNPQKYPAWLVHGLFEKRRHRWFRLF